MAISLWKGFRLGGRPALMQREHALECGLFGACAVALSIPETGNACGNLLESGCNRIDDSCDGLCSISGLEGVGESEPYRAANQFSGHARYGNRNNREYHSERRVAKYVVYRERTGAGGGY